MEKEVQEVPTCGHEGELYLHGRCHLGSPTWAVLSADRSTVRIECAECRREVAVLMLKKGE